MEFQRCDRKKTLLIGLYPARRHLVPVWLTHADKWACDGPLALTQNMPNINTRIIVADGCRTCVVWTYSWHAPMAPDSVGAAPVSPAMCVVKPERMRMCGGGYKPRTGTFISTMQSIRPLLHCPTLQSVRVAYLASTPRSGQTR